MHISWIKGMVDNRSHSERQVSGEYTVENHKQIAEYNDEMCGKYIIISCDEEDDADYK